MVWVHGDIQSVPPGLAHCPFHYPKVMTFPRNGGIYFLEYTRTQTVLFFYFVLLYCQSSDRPFITACAVLHSSV